MTFKNVTIIGLGLIGSSLAFALKKSGKVEQVIGVDIEQETIDYALSNRIIDQGSTEYGGFIAESEIVVVATYIESIIEITKEILPHVGEDTIITDTGSVKGRIVKEIERTAPDHINFIGGHPITGTENSGVKFADPELYVNKRCILTPVENTNSYAIDKVKSLWEAAGSIVFTMDPDTHDHVLGFVSHLPHVVAYSLINSVLDSEDSETMVEFAGGGLRDYTRVAASSPEMWTEIILSNKEKVLKAIQAYKTSIGTIESAISNNDAELLTKEFEKASNFKRGK